MAARQQLPLMVENTQDKLLHEMDIFSVVDWCAYGGQAIKGEQTGSGTNMMEKVMVIDSTSTFLDRKNEEEKLKVNKT